MAPFFYANPINRNPTMNYAIAGGAIVGVVYQETSQLSRLTERLRRIGRWFIDNLNERGNP